LRKELIENGRKWWCTVKVVKFITISMRKDETIYSFKRRFIV